MTMCRIHGDPGADVRGNSWGEAAVTRASSSSAFSASTVAWRCRCFSPSDQNSRCTDYSMCLLQRAGLVFVPFGNARSGSSYPIIVRSETCLRRVPNRSSGAVSGSCFQSDHKPKLCASFATQGLHSAPLLEHLLDVGKLLFRVDAHRFVNVELRGGQHSSAFASQNRRAVREVILTLIVQRLDLGQRFKQ